MKRPLVSVIIVNWNGKVYLKVCLVSLFSCQYKPIEIFFVDNASTDGSVEYVKKHFPKIKIFKNSANLGFAGGHDVALSKARGEAVLLLNTDTVVQKDVVEKLVRVLYSDTKIAAVQPKILLDSQRKLIDSIGCFFLSNGLLYHFGREKLCTMPLYNKEMDVFSAKGVCLLLRRKAINQVGLFDRDFYAYFEETDLCMRLWLAGFRVVYTPTTSVLHVGGASSRQSDSRFIQFHSQKNAICTYLKNLSFFYLIRVMPKLLLFYACASVFYLFTGKISDAFVPLKAIWWNAFHIQETLRKRHIVQHVMRSVSDDDYVPKLTKSVGFRYYYYKVFGGMGRYIDG
ncbi:glycosyltransferase family 2 protein [Candidatus Gottesmanbacteria bacterium]|nr:glycosyltransferase family 2 protein [Candidatus Gottesmanbacteria bacterium]